MTKPIRSPLVDTVIGCAIEVHRALGPGLLESAYDRCLLHEFSLRGVQFAHQVGVPVMYKDMRIECGYRADYLIDRSLVLELKAVDSVLPIHQAQVLTYAKLMKVNRALLINFNVTRLVDGLKSFLVS
jgi:GxxExxY protein